MKSPYGIAKELGISPQAVYKKLTDEFIIQLDNHIQPNEKGGYLLDAEGERLLKGLFSPVEQPTIKLIEPAKQVNQPLLNQLNIENDFLRKRIEI